MTHSQAKDFDPAVSTHEQYKERRFFRALDGFRCISILAVIWHHTKDDDQLIPILGRGFLGVDMFYILSGFLITTLLLRERERTGTILLGKFHVRRLLRIFPLYYGLLLLFSVALLLKPQAGMAQPFFSELPFYLTFTSNWIHTGTIMSVAWSLSTEAQFYLIWPPIEKFIRRPSWVLSILAGLLFINQLVNFGVLDQPLLAVGLDRTKLEILQATFTPIILGVFLAHALHYKQSYDRLLSWLHPTWMPVGLSVLTVLACNLPTFGGPLTWQRLIMQLFMALLLASCLIQDNGWLSHQLNLAPIRRIGMISYGMYLLHMIARHVAQAILERTGISFTFDLFLLCFAITVVMSELSFRFYEQPFLNFKQGFKAIKEKG